MDLTDYYSLIKQYFESYFYSILVVWFLYCSSFQLYSIDYFRSNCLDLIILLIFWIHCCFNFLEVWLWNHYRWYLNSLIYSFIFHFCNYQNFHAFVGSILPVFIYLAILVLEDCNLHRDGEMQSFCIVVVILETLYPLNIYF